MKTCSASGSASRIWRAPWTSISSSTGSPPPPAARAPSAASRSAARRTPRARQRPRRRAAHRTPRRRGSGSRRRRARPAAAPASSPRRSARLRQLIAQQPDQRPLPHPRRARNDDHARQGAQTIRRGAAAVPRRGRGRSLPRATPLGRAVRDAGPRATETRARRTLRSPCRTRYSRTFAGDREAAASLQVRRSRPLMRAQAACLRIGSTPSRDRRAGGRGRLPVRGDPPDRRDVDLRRPGRKDRPRAQPTAGRSRTSARRECAAARRSLCAGAPRARRPSCSARSGTAGGPCWP